MSIELYSHNKFTYKKILEMFETGNRVGVVQPTGTGKSFLFLKWIEDHPGDSFVVLSPSTEIFTQLREYSELSGNSAMLDSVQMISYQSLLRMSDDEIQDVQVNKIILDEFHRTGAELWGPALQKLLDVNPSSKILGASATPVRYSDNVRDMAAELFDRNLASEMTLGEAVRKGILPAPKYVPVWYDIDGKLAQYERDVFKIKDIGERREMLEQLARMRRRLENSYGAGDIFLKNMTHDHGKFIVFCRDKLHLDEMQKTIPQWLAGVNLNVRRYVSISEQEDKDIQLQAFKDDNGQDAVKLLFTIDRLNEGVHVKGIDGVMMLRPTVSPVVYLQQMGRALASGNDAPLVFDLVNNYQSVRVPIENGKWQNVFERELMGGSGSKTEIGDFQIFEEMAEFAGLFDGLESSLYPNNDEIWERTLNEYVRFLQENGREPSRACLSGDEKTLADWAHTQRGVWKNGSLSPEREARLVAVGFVFDTLEAAWVNNFENYISFKQEHGREPSMSWKTPDEKTLATWVCNLRQAWKKGDLSDERVEQLLSAGFVFDPLDNAWQNNFQAYSAFKERNGREPLQNGSTDIERGLAVWASNQRKALSKGTLSSAREEQLMDIGFVFDSAKTSWENHFYDYVTFRDKYSRDPSKYGDTNEEKGLASWVSTQRKSWKTGSLLPEREAQLLSVGFVFDARETTWMNKLRGYVAFHKEYGKNPSRRSTIHEEIVLANWAAIQRQAWRDGVLSFDRERQLKAIGFDFGEQKGKPKDQDTPSLEDLIGAAKNSQKTNGVQNLKKVNLERD